MNKFIRTMLVASVACAFWSSTARAQLPVQGPGGAYPQNRPAYSPYLNLLRAGGSAQQNYFGLVRPELNANNSLYGLQQQLGNDQQSINQLAAAGGTTGHQVSFLNTGTYFQSMRPVNGLSNNSPGGSYGSSLGNASFGAGAGGFGAGGTLPGGGVGRPGGR